MSIPPLPFTMDCSPFLNWSGEAPGSESEKAEIFRSLVATVKSQPALDDSLEAKAVKFLESVKSHRSSPADDFLGSFASSTDESLTSFVQCIVVLISSASQIVTTASIEMLYSQIPWCSAKLFLTLVKADLISQIIASLNPMFLSLAEAVDIHITVMKIITDCFWLTTPDCQKEFGFKDDYEQQAVQETVLKQVVTPSEKTGIEAYKNQRTIRTVSDLFWTTNTVCVSFLLALTSPHGFVCRNDWNSLSPRTPSLDGRHTLLLLRRHSRTAPTAPKWKLSMLTIGSGSSSVVDADAMAFRNRSTSSIVVDTSEWRQNQNGCSYTPSTRSSLSPSRNEMRKEELKRGKRCDRNDAGHASLRPPNDLPLFEPGRCNNE
ncbi:hypothetical protein BLNAU_8001 [Blattamonas nauphoetae]|uniref:Uncharacterized protein n=1 Tax=Blattamonas nauphoetae TaxID=2049346 RepID=A0ABQ9XZL8_9EUKA|nr:hypothetical protein BLNAU_8001 [Blattamonas nauphoetae]